MHISVFGTGFGESIVVHYGNNEWLVIDSCRNPATRDVCPLWFFNELGVNVATQVKFIVASHWDKDHVMGISDIATHAESARFYISQALGSEEFLTLMNGCSAHTGVVKKAHEEIAAVYKTYVDRAVRGSVGRLELVQGDRILVRDNIVVNGITIPREIGTLSPSSNAVLRGCMEIAAQIPEHTQPYKKLPRLHNNDISVVVYVKLGTRVALLGSDLEEINIDEDGWRKVLQSACYPSVAPATFFKVPHHGSETGHHADVWANMVATQNITVTTPWKLGGKELPKTSDVARIKALSQTAFLSGLRGQAEEVEFTGETKKTLSKLRKAPTRTIMGLGIISLQGDAKDNSEWTLSRSGQTYDMHTEIDVAA